MRPRWSVSRKGRATYNRPRKIAGVHTAETPDRRRPCPSSDRRCRPGVRKCSREIKAAYTTSPENHHPMELFATTVKWGDNIVTVYDKTQSPKSVELFLKVAFRLIGRKVRVVSSYVGGGFGLGLRPQQSVFLAVMAAKSLKRSVRLVLPRDHMFALGTEPTPSKPSRSRPTRKAVSSDQA